jgi:hypothetical protein
MPKLMYMRKTKLYLLRRILKKNAGELWNIP